MFLADRIMIDIAHHIDYFAGHCFEAAASAFFAVLMFLRNSERRARQRGDERRGRLRPSRISLVCSMLN